MRSQYALCDMFPVLYFSKCASNVPFFSLEHHKFSARASRSHYLTSEKGIIFTSPRKQSLKCPIFRSDSQKFSARVLRLHYLTSKIPFISPCKMSLRCPVFKLIWFQLALRACINCLVGYAYGFFLFKKKCLKCLVFQFGISKKKFRSRYALALFDWRERYSLHKSPRTVLKMFQFLRWTINIFRSHSWVDAKGP